MLRELIGAILPAAGKKTAVPAVRQDTAITRVEPKYLPATAEEMPLHVRAKAAERLDFVRSVRAAITEQALNAPEAVQFVALNYAHRYELLTRSGRGGASQLNYGNYRRWAAALDMAKTDEAALRQLADDYRRGIQPRRGDEEFWRDFFATYLNLNRLPLTVAYKLAVKKIRRDRPGTPVPTLNQVAYRVGQLDPQTVILAREGETALRNKCLDYISRDWSDIAPGELVIGDSRTFDTRVRVWDEERQRWIGVRPTIAALIDGRSWYLASYWITTEPVNHLTLIDTVALYCVQTGGVPPAVAYFDNGKDYCAKGFATPVEVDGFEHSIFKELGIRLINSLPFNARAKTIERSFRDMMQRFDKLLPDYLGSKPGDRTIAADYFDKHPEELPSPQQFCELFASYIEEYHHTPKNGDIHRGKTPAELWQARPERAALNPERLKMAFLKPVGVRSVSRGPAIQLDRTWYYSDALRFGDRVLVKVDRLDADHIYCYRPDGSLIGEARTRDRIKALALDDAASRAEIGRQIARQRRQTVEARTILNELTGGRHLLSPVEIFYADADANLIAGASIASVKGSSHSYRRVSTESPILPAAAEPAKAPDFDFKEDRNEAADADFAASIGGARPPQADHSGDDDVAEMHDFITSKRGGRDDE